MKKLPLFEDFTDVKESSFEQDDPHGSTFMSWWNANYENGETFQWVSDDQSLYIFDEGGDEIARPTYKELMVEIDGLPNDPTLVFESMSAKPYFKSDYPTMASLPDLKGGYVAEFSDNGDNDWLSIFGATGEEDSRIFADEIGFNCMDTGDVFTKKFNGSLDEANHMVFTLTTMDNDEAVDYLSSLGFTNMNVGYAQ